MHKVVAHSNMIKWCVVWRHSQHLSHPLALLCISPLHETQTQTYTHTRTRALGFPFPEPCFENRSFVLTVNSRAWQVQSDHPLRHENPALWGNRRHVLLRWTCHRKKAERHTHAHTWGMQGNTCGKNTEVWWRETCRGGGGWVFRSTTAGKLAIPQCDDVFYVTTGCTLHHFMGSQAHHRSSPTP